jgi:hypothetical protein
MGSSAYGGGVAAFGALVPGPGRPPSVEYPNADAPINDATVENSDVVSGIRADATPYVQPNVTAPEDNSEVAASSSLAEAGPNQIEATGENYIQPATSNPVSNPAVTVGGSVNGNPMGL